MHSNKNNAQRYTAAETNMHYRAILNQSAQGINQSKDNLNSTAPINFS